MKPEANLQFASGHAYQTRLLTDVEVAVVSGGCGCPAAPPGGVYDCTNQVCRPAPAPGGTGGTGGTTGHGEDGAAFPVNQPGQSRP
jgi:hypothetical protein